MLKKIKLYSTLLLLIIGFENCNKKEYSIKVDGHIYSNCNQEPVENAKVRLYNSDPDGFSEVTVKTDKYGYFNAELKGEGNYDFKIEIDDIYTGPISSCNLNIFKSDTSYLRLTKVDLNNKDTLYASVFPVDYLNSINFIPPIYKIPLSDFTSNNVIIKIDRRGLLNYSMNSNLALNKLWSENLFDAYLIWGVGKEQYLTNKEKFIKNTFNFSDRITKLNLKSCDNVYEIILY